MRDIPILFSTPMVQAILDLRKNMTRRLNNLEEINQEPERWSFKGLDFNFSKGILVAEFYDGHGRGRSIKCPWQPGNLLWVRETWQCVKYDSMDGDLSYGVEFKDGARKYFEFDDNERYHQFGKFAFKEGWQPSIYLPKEAARIWLEVTNVRVERLQELTEEDAIKEGVLSLGDPSAESNWGIGFAKACFRKLWDSLNAKRGYGWDPNPWVWVISFKKVTPCD